MAVLPALRSGGEGLPGEAAAAVPAQMLEATNLVGPKSYVKERLAAYKEAGVTILSVNPVGPDPVKAIETLRRLKGMDKPFFLGVGFHKPHLPFTCPQKYWDLYPTDTVKLPDNYFPPKNVPEPALHNWYELRTYGGIPAKGGISDETALNLIRGYRACISFMDAQVGKVLAARILSVAS